MNSNHAMRPDEYQYVLMECESRKTGYNDGLANKGAPFFIVTSL